MKKQPQSDHSEEQIRYAKVLYFLSRSGLILVMFSFFVYVLGNFPTFVKVNQMADFLSLSSGEFISETKIPTGWNWIKFLNRGEVIGNVGIVYLSLSTVICFITILPNLLHQRKISYFFIAAIQVLVLVLAASGWLSLRTH